VATRFQGKDGHIALDQLRTVDKSRLAKRLGIISSTAQAEVLSTLAAMFAP
jgi:mRNA interferase MazF